MCETADHHVLRIAGDGRGRADIRGHRHRQQVWHRVAPQCQGELDDERRQHQAHRVVDEKCREHPGDRRDRGQQGERPVSPPHDPAPGHREKAGEAQISDEDHHAEQQGQRVEIDRLIGFIER
jgi:hypothetical protein